MSAGVRRAGPPAGGARTSVAAIARRAIAGGEASRRTAKVTLRPTAGLRRKRYKLGARGHTRSLRAR